VWLFQAKAEWSRTNRLLQRIPRLVDGDSSFRPDAPGDKCDESNAAPIAKRFKGNRGRRHARCCDGSFDECSRA